jgi:hypothetical protein
MVDVHDVSAGYFEVLRIPLVRGRLFSESDRRDAAPVVILGESAARKYFPSGDALGAVLAIGIEAQLAAERTVIGVVRDLRLDSPERPARPEAYLPLPQRSVSGADLVVRTSADPLAVAPAIKATIWAAEPRAVIPEVQSLEARLDWIIAPRTFNMLLFAIFGGVAIAIAAAGVYGLQAQQVQQRERGIAVRLALGAVPAQILSLILGRAARYLLVGLALGIVGAWNLAALVDAFLFQVTPRDFVVYAAAALLLLAAGLTAGLLPARRAMRLDPATTLRSA